MIKNVELKPFDKLSHLPTYVNDVKTYTLIATVPGDYEIVLAKLTVGTSMSAGNILSHALFESFNERGKRMSVARTRVSGYEREFVAVKNAMLGTGVVFNPVIPCSNESLMEAMGKYFKEINPEIIEYKLVSQTWR